ncbi:hypothetical protein DITRI_Ditri09bG0090200 [Diplodiscus trichospermus]
MDAEVFVVHSEISRHLIYVQGSTKNVRSTIACECRICSASLGGTGRVKTITNYALVMKAITRAKNRGFSDVLYLDAKNRKYLEDVSSCNIFIVKGNLISTPAANGTILEGVTQKSIIEIARDHGYQVTI